jgi:hypothetical protein
VVQHHRAKLGGLGQQGYLVVVQALDQVPDELQLSVFAGTPRSRWFLPWA